MVELTVVEATLARLNPNSEVKPGAGVGECASPAAFTPLQLAQGLGHSCAPRVLELKRA